MSNEYFIKEYMFNFNDRGFDFKLKPTTSKETAKTIILTTLLASVFLFFAYFCFLNTGYFYSVASLIIFFLISLGGFLNIMQRKKREKRFHFLIDYIGISHVDIDACYHIKWADVASFGFVDKNVISGTRSSQNYPTQTCLYFAKLVYDEKYLRRKFDRIENRFHRHCSTEQMIVFSFLQDELPEWLYTKMNSYIQLYIDKNNENSFTARSNY